MSKNNVINLSKHRLNKRTNTKANSSGISNAPILDMTERRNKVLQTERRQVKRTILTEFIGAFVVVPQRGLMKVTLYDISEEGVAFDIEDMKAHFNDNEKVAMRVYMNHSTYFPLTAQIQNIRMIQDEGVIRHGAHFVKGIMNDKALHHFVKFIETVSVSLRTDDGDMVMVSGIKR